MFGWFNRFRRKFAEKHSVGYWHSSTRAKYPYRIAYDFSVIISEDHQLTKHEWHKLDKDLKRIWDSYEYLSKESTYDDRDGRRGLKAISGPDHETRDYRRKLINFHTHLCADKAYPVDRGVYKRFNSVYFKITKLYNDYSDETWMEKSSQRIKVDELYDKIQNGVLKTVNYYNNVTKDIEDKKAEVIKLPRTKRQQKRAA